METRRAIAAGGVLIVMAASLAACKKTTEEGSNVDTNRVTTGVIATDPKDSRGPAPEVPGAAKGGTFTIIRQSKISHMDPQRIYSFAGLVNAPLYARTLTFWKDDGKGKLTLIGDLAETPGKNVNNDCKVWEYKLKSGLKFEDGRPITSKEVAYGIARSFDPDLTGGPTYIQEWLADDADYDQVWDFKSNKTALPLGLSTPDASTIKFEFKKPRCDLPFALSLPASAPLPADKDTGVNLDNNPFSSGPYKITKHQVGVELVFERNEHWDPATDPVRHQYPDKIMWTFGPNPEAGANRVIADSGTDQSALAFGGVPASLVAKVAGNSAYASRTLNTPAPSAGRLTINTQRVTDLAVRRALNYAIDRDGLIKTLGGSTVAVPNTTIMPPSTLGYESYDAYPAGRNGNLDEAKKLLAGKTPELVLVVADNSEGTEVGTQLKTNLEKAGFKITVKTVPADAKLDETKKKDNPWDIWIDEWAADWPSGASILPVLFDGRAIKAEGNSNSSLINNDAINKEFDRVLAMDPGAQAPEWAKLDKRIMTELAPCVPLYVDVAYYLHGSKAGGLFVSSIWGVPAFTDVFVKS